MSTKTIYAGAHQHSIESVNGEFITREALVKAVPVIGNDGTNHNMTDRYIPISTMELIDILEEAGFGVVSAFQSKPHTRPNNRNKLAHARHCVRFRNPNLSSLFNGEEDFEIVALNSFNGQTQLEMSTGVFRPVCSNGMVVGDTCSSAAIRHIGEKASIMTEAVQIIDSAPEVADMVSRMKGTLLRPKQMTDMAKGIAAVRFGDDDIERINFQEMLKPLRSADTGKDVWTIFNRLQEKVIKGGIAREIIDGGEGSPTQRTSSRLKNPVEIIRVNRESWDVAESFLETV